MRSKKILITGGAGFIGSFLTDLLISKGYSVRIFDNLDKQVHLNGRPSYLNPKAEFVIGDVRDYSAFSNAISDCTIIFHLASKVGVGQANYQIKEYVDVNIGGMTNLLDILLNKKHSVKKILFASSMTIFGEGAYQCISCGEVKPPVRSDAQIMQKKWNLFCPICKKRVNPIATKEDAVKDNKGIYAYTKNVSEELLLFFGKTYGIPVVSLRLFNVYGPRQSLSNPYTGVSAIFLSRIMNGNPPLINEDGKQTRDFISVHDVVAAFYHAMVYKIKSGEVFNIGSGNPISIKDVAGTLYKIVSQKQKFEITQNGRKGDLRHCFADIEKAKKLLKWKPKISFMEGMEELVEWSKNERAVDMYEKSLKELKEKNLIV